jgi:hypothetical protein
MQADDRHPPMRRRVLASIGAAGLLGALGIERAARAATAPMLETVATFGDDFRLVGIGVSKQGRVFATAPASAKRSRYSMVEVDTKTGALKPFPDESWNTYKPGDDGTNAIIYGRSIRR